MATLLPKDDDNNIIPTLRLRGSGGAHMIAAAATTARNSTAFNAETKVVSLYAAGAVYVRFGSSTVTATTADHYFPQGVYYDFAISGGDARGPRNSYVAVLAVGAACSVYVSEKE